MPREKSAGAVIFRREKDEISYLLLRYPSGAKAKKSYWDLPKGHVETDETEIETAKREVAEETGLKDINIVKGFREVIKYFFRAEGKTIFKTVSFYLAESEKGDVKISFEHTGFQWLPYDKAIHQLTFKNAKDVVRKANGCLIPK